VFQKRLTRSTNIWICRSQETVSVGVHCLPRGARCHMLSRCIVLWFLAAFAARQISSICSRLSCSRFVQISRFFSLPEPGPSGGNLYRECGSAFTADWPSDDSDGSFLVVARFASRTEFLRLALQFARALILVVFISCSRGRRLCGARPRPTREHPN